MKKFISLTAALLLAVPSFGAGLSVNGIEREGDFPIVESRIYAPVDSLKDIFADPTDVLEIDGESYLPVRSNCESSGYTVSWNNETSTAEILTDDVYADLDGRYYILTVDGKVVGVENDSADNSALLIADESKTDSWCFTSKGGNYYSLINKNSGKSIDIPASSTDAGKAATQYTANGGGNQTLELLKQDDGQYLLRFKHSGLYLTLTDAGLAQDELTGDAKQLFSLKYAGESAMRSVKRSAGYLALDDATRERFDSYIYDSQAFTPNIYSSAAALIESENYLEKSVDEQKEILKKCLDITAYSLVYIGEVPPLDEEINVEVSDKTYIESYDVWRGSMEPVWTYKVSMSDGYTMTLITTVEDCSVVEDAANALSRFPLAIRKYLSTLIHRMDEANNYNGGGNTIWIRLNYIPSENAIAQTLAHELGHVLDSNLTTDDAVWEEAIKADMVPVSGYGNNNRTEDLAEFSRLYHMARRSDELMEAIGKVYPNRMKAYKALLYAADNEYYADFKPEYEELSPFAVGQEESYSIISPDGSNLVLTAVNETGQAGEKLVLSKYTGKDTQLWFVRERKDGAVVIFNKATGYCVNIPGNSDEDGKALITWNGSGGSNETWDVETDSKGLKSFKVRNSGLYLGFDGDTVIQTSEETFWSVEKA